MYVILWRFTVRHRADFERHYGPNGTWAAFFRRDPAFIRTELLRGEENDYVTLDYWTTAEAFAAFRAAHFAEYETIDKEFEALTDSEERLGAFVTV